VLGKRSPFDEAVKLPFVSEETLRSSPPLPTELHALNYITGSRDLREIKKKNYLVGGTTRDVISAMGEGSECQLGLGEELRF
jgi:hypothetical protein